MPFRLSLTLLKMPSNMYLAWLIKSSKAAQLLWLACSQWVARHMKCYEIFCSYSSHVNAIIQSITYHDLLSPADQAPDEREGDADHGRILEDLQHVIMQSISNGEETAEQALGSLL